MRKRAFSIQRRSVANVEEEKSSAAVVLGDVEFSGLLARNGSLTIRELCSNFSYIFLETHTITQTHIYLMYSTQKKTEKLLKFILLIQFSFHFIHISHFSWHPLPFGFSISIWTRIMISLFENDAMLWIIMINNMNICLTILSWNLLNIKTLYFHFFILHSMPYHTYSYIASLQIPLFLIFQFNPCMYNPPGFYYMKHNSMS